MASDASACSPTIIISVDASREAADCFNYYADEVYQKHHKIILLHVLELTLVPGKDDTAPLIADRIWAEEVRRAEALEVHFSELANNKGIIDFAFRTVQGVKPGEVIVDVANKEKATTIVMGTRGMGLIRRTVLGSVSDYVLHHAHCPVIIYRQSGHKQLKHQYQKLEQQQ